MTWGAKREWGIQVPQPLIRDSFRAIKGWSLACQTK
jgi:hypothetical protein